MGSIVWLFTALRGKPGSIIPRIKAYQIDFSYLYDVKQYRFILLQYILGGLGLIYLLAQYASASDPFVWIGVGVLVSRYAIMSFSWGRLPQLPLIKEIVDSISRVIHFISHR
jgi:hypothetical protein